jgi:hypothetical protein
MDYTTLTKEKLSEINQVEIMDLTFDEWYPYFLRSKEVGNEYFYNGIMKHTPIIYGTSDKRLTYDTYTKEWRLGMGAVVPDCEVKPLMVSKEKFEELMLAHGVPAEIMKVYFETEYTADDYENF